MLTLLCLPLVVERYEILLILGHYDCTKAGCCG